MHVFITRTRTRPAPDIKYKKNFKFGMLLLLWKVNRVYWDDEENGQDVFFWMEARGKSRSVCSFVHSILVFKQVFLQVLSNLNREDMEREQDKRKKLAALDLLLGILVKIIHSYSWTSCCLFFLLYLPRRSACLSVKFNLQGFLSIVKLVK